MVKPDDGVELGGLVVEEEDVLLPVAADVLTVGEDGEGWLAGVVGEEEAAGGGGAAPAAADGAAAEDGLGVQADQDLPEDDGIREFAEERRRSCCCRHGRRLGLAPLPAEGVDND